MKKFTKQFMNLTMVFAAVNALSLVKAFAQDIDYDAINTKIVEYEERNNQKPNKPNKPQKEKKESFLIQENLRRDSLPKNRRLTDTEDEQKSLMECVTQFISKKKGLYSGPEVIYKILKQAMDPNMGLTSDSYILNETTNKCWEAYNSIIDSKPQSKKVYAKAVEVNVDFIEPDNRLEERLKNFIRNQYKNKPICIRTSVSAKAGFIVAVNAGLSNLKCLYPNGRVRNYIGPKLKLEAGLGAAIELNQYRTIGLVTTAPLALVADSSDLYTHGEMVLGLGRSGNMFEGRYFKEEEKARSTSQSVGLGVFAEALYGGSINIRSFNGARNWSYVIDQLK